VLRFIEALILLFVLVFGNLKLVKVSSLYRLDPIDIYAAVGVEHRRPHTADSTKTSLMDSDENLDGEESN
jgi:aminopeptidase N